MPVVARLVEHAGRLSRAAVFAGLAACTSNPPPQNIQQQPPPPPPDATTATVTTTTTFAQPPPDGSSNTNTDTHGPLADTGRVEGIIRLASGAAAANIQVLLVGTNSNRQATTDAKGHYVFEQVPEGRYQVSIDRNEIDDNPHHYQVPPSTYVTVTADVAAHADLKLPPPPPPDRGPCCKPYGAPPARRRVV